MRLCGVQLLSLAVCLVSVVALCNGASARPGSWLGSRVAPGGERMRDLSTVEEEEEEGGQNKSGSSGSNWICHVSKAYNMTAGPVNVTFCASRKSSMRPEYLGYIGGIVAVIFFGSNFVPVKKFETGDGVFFQWVLCIGIWLVGLVVHFILDSPIFFLPTVIGGFLWTTGNMMVVPIIKMVGLTMGLTVWGVTNMLGGWIMGTFVFKQTVSCAGMSYGGVATVVISVVILAFVKSEGNSPEDEENQSPSEKTALLGGKTTLEGSLSERLLQKSSVRVTSPTSINSSNGADDRVTFGTASSSSASSASNGVMAGTVDDAELREESVMGKMRGWHKKLAGFGLSMIAGLLFSCLFLPVQFLKNCVDDAHSCRDLDYLFGVYCGILFTSTAYFFLYSIICRNKPRVYPKAILPALISGLMWGVAMAGWFVSNQHLPLAVSFPLVTAGPGFVSSIWGILIYREITGLKNLVLFFVALLVSLTGLIMNGLSKAVVPC